MKKIIQDFYCTYGYEKFVFNVLNGGWEKVFQTEFGYSLLKQLIPKGGWVKMEDNNVDLQIYKGGSPDFIIEIGHHFINQTPQKLHNFKPFNDIVKRALQGYENILHIMLIDEVLEDPDEKFKYNDKGTNVPARHNNIYNYLKLYIAAGLSCVVLKKTKIKELGCKVDSYIILSYPSVGGVNVFIDGVNVNIEGDSVAIDNVDITRDVKDIITAEESKYIEETKPGKYITVKDKENDKIEFKVKVKVEQGIKILAGNFNDLELDGKKITKDNNKKKVEEAVIVNVKDLVGKDIDGNRIKEILDDLDNF